MANDKPRASFTEFSKGGFMDDVDVMFTNCKFTMYDYDGNAPEAPVFMVDLVLLDGEDNQQPRRQVWSCGSPKDWEPSADGMSLNPARDGIEKIRENTKFITLMKSMIENGYPSELLAKATADIFEGSKFHLIQIPAPEYKGLDKKKKTGKDGKEYADTIPVINKIISVGPQEAAGKGKKASGKSAATTSEPSAETVSIEEAAEATLTTMIMEAGGELKKTQIPTLGVKNAELKNNPNKSVIMKKMFDDKFITSKFTLKDGVITLKE